LVCPERMPRSETNRQKMRGITALPCLLAIFDIVVDSNSGEGKLPRQSAKPVSPRKCVHVCVYVMVCYRSS